MRKFVHSHDGLWFLNSICVQEPCCMHCQDVAHHLGFFDFHAFFVPGVFFELLVCCGDQLIERQCYFPLLSLLNGVGVLLHPHLGMVFHTSQP